MTFPVFDLNFFLPKHRVRTYIFPLTDHFECINVHWSFKILTNTEKYLHLIVHVFLIFRTVAHSKKKQIGIQAMAEEKGYKELVPTFEALRPTNINVNILAAHQVLS